MKLKLECTSVTSARRDRRFHFLRGLCLYVAVMGAGGITGEAVAVEGKLTPLRAVGAPSLSTQTQPSPFAQTIPANGATSVRINEPITVKFERPMRRGTLTKDSVTMLGPIGAAAFALEISKDNRSMTVTPSEDLFPGTGYTLFVRDALDAEGRDIGLMTLEFKTQKLDASAELSTDQEVEDNDAYTPSRDAPGTWRSSRPLPAFVEARLHLPKYTASGTGISGLVLRLNDSPLAKVTVSIEGESTRTDEEGHFLLSGVAPGRHEMIVDGESANWPGHEYPQLVVNVEIKEGKVTELVHPVYLPRIRAKDWFSIPSPTLFDGIVAFRSSISSRAKRINCAG